ncbi:hypothetical protein [Streptomyces sp. NPDC050564]|uniref:hypothetical protein n=1 Tax=Streptomyces sp. NPDC050564 TaxID=3365631 RepID=UPI00378BA85D
MHVTAGPRPRPAAHRGARGAQAWAVGGWTTLLSRDGGLVAILRDRVVLAVFATVLLTLASLALRHRLTAGEAC